MQVGKFKFKHLILATCRLRVQNPHILATCRLGNQTASLKALLHAGRENQSPNPCFRHFGKSNPKIFATCGLGISRTQILATCRLGEAKSSNQLLYGNWELRYPSPRPLQIFATWKFWKPKQSNLCYMQVWKPKHSNLCCTPTLPQTSCYMRLERCGKLVDLR